MSGQVDITVLVATYNRCRSLGEFLESFRQQRNTSHFSFELVLVDNNSNDGTRQVAEKFAAEAPFPATYLFQPAQGKSRALNLGLRSAKGRVVAFTDDDVCLDPYWLSNIYEYAVVKGYPVIQGRVLLHPEVPVPSWAGEDVLKRVAVTDLGETASPYEIGLVGANMTIAADLFGKFGNFREDLGPGSGVLGGEDNELSRRFRDGGIQQMYVPQICVHHDLEPWRLTKKYIRKLAFSQGASRALLLDPNRNRRRYFNYQAKEFAKELFLLAGRKLRGDEQGAFRYEAELYARAGLMKGLLKK